MLADAGYEIVERKAPSIDEASDLWRLVLANEMRAGLYPLMLDKGDEMVQRTMGQMLSGIPELDRDGFLKAFARRSSVLREWQTFFAEVPLMLTSVNWIEPFRRGEDQADDFDFETFWRKVTPTIPAPILGLPGLTVPVGTAPGKPMGVQLMATRFAEPVLMAAAAVLERALGGPVAPIDPVFPAGGPVS